MARRFVNSFVIQTDATFNTNKLSMALSILVRVTNTVASFLLAYPFISFESAKAFKFVNACYKSSSFGIIVLDLLLY